MFFYKIYRRLLWLRSWSQGAEVSPSLRSEMRPSTTAPPHITASIISFGVLYEDINQRKR